MNKIMLSRTTLAAESTYPFVLQFFRDLSLSAFCITVTE